MNDYFQQLIEGKIDFEGQKKVDLVARVGLIAVTVLSFVLGFALQSLRITFTTFGFSTILLCLVIVPPWPMYNRYPVQWLPLKEKETKSE